MSRFFSFAYGIVCYAMFLGVFLYFVGFVADVGVAKTVSSGQAGAPAAALTTDIALIVLFGLQHSIMARKRFKRWLTRFLSESIERSTYVLATNFVLLLLFIFWQPLPGHLWRIENPVLATSLQLLCALGWLLVLLSTFLTNHFDLFGLRQVYLNLVRASYTPVDFKEILLYRWIRHPMMLGLLIALWATPLMSSSHLLLSLGLSLYILIGIHFEEAALKAELGTTYLEYMGRTARLLPYY